MDDVLRLIEDIYEAGARPEHWHATMNRLADATGSADATMGGQTSSQVQIFSTARTDPDYLRSYAEHYHTRNPMQLASIGQPVGKAVLDFMILDVEHFKASDFFNEWCLPQRLHGGASINLAATGGWRATVMVSGPDPYNADTVKLLNAVAPHLCRAFQLNQALNEAQALGLSAMAALEHTSKGVFLIDRNGNARPANAMAQTLLGQADGLTLQEGRLAAQRNDDTAAIDRAIGSCQRGIIEATGASVSVARGPDSSALELLCIPFPASAWWPGFDQNLALIFVTDPDARREALTLRLRRNFGLTPAEAALAWEIVHSGGRQSAAANRGVSVATVRSQLSSIFDKTGVRRQADLVRLLLQDGDDR